MLPSLPGAAVAAAHVRVIPGIEAPRPTVVRWRILAWIVAASIVAYVLRFNLSVAGPSMMRDLGLTEGQLGMILGAFAWSYGLFQAPGGLLGERIGPRRSMTLLFLGWFATTALMAAVPRSWPVAAAVALLIVLRAGQGAVQAPLFPITAGGSMFAWLPPNTWALGNSLSTAGATVGAAAAGPAVTWLVVAAGWRQSFLIVAPLGLALAAVWWRDYRDDPAKHRGVNLTELALINTGRAPATGAAPIKWTGLLANRDLLCVTLSYFCMNYVFYIFFNWFFYYLTEIRHVPATLGGYFVGAQWMVGAVTAVAGGLTCDRLSGRLGARAGCRATAIGGLVLSAPLLVAGTLAPNAVVMVVLLSLSFGCIQFVDGAYWAATMRIAGPQAQTATGMLNTGGNIVGGIGAMLVPAIAGSFGWTAAVASGAVFSLAAAALWFGVRADVPLQRQAAPVQAITDPLLPLRN
jgi:ACS family glucarate transporter-like MFS transporter